jgi:ankyrin repeat protein
MLDMRHMFYIVLQDGKTALMGACAGGHLSVVNYLVDRGADIDATDNVSYNI